MEGPGPPSHFHLTPWAPPGGGHVPRKASIDFRQYLTPTALQAPVFSSVSRTEDTALRESLPRRHSYSDPSSLRQGKASEAENSSHFLPPGTPGVAFSTKKRSSSLLNLTAAAAYPGPRPFSLPSISRCKLGHQKRVPSAYKSKYDHEMVLLLRDFYEEMLVVSGLERKSLVPAQFTASSLGTLDPIARKSLMNALGNGPVTFKKILSTMFPNANDRDVTAMIAFAYPPQKVEEYKEPEITAEQRQELSGVFGMFDLDGSGNISFPEFMEAVKHLKIPREEAKFMMAAMDADGDGNVSLDEFVRWLAPIYFGIP